MKLSTILCLMMFQSTTTLVAYITHKDHLLEAGVVSTICVIAYAVGQMVFRRTDFEKTDVKVGLVLGVFMGLLAQVCQFYWADKSGAITVGLIVVCLFPKQIGDMLLRFIKNKSEKL